jgi:hypothetical protein
MSTFDTPVHAATPAPIPSAPFPPSTSAPAAAPSDEPLVQLCEASRRELFMLETPHTLSGTCDRCDATHVWLCQYPRSTVRLDHLAAADRDAFNRKLDAIIAAADTAAEAQAAKDAATKKAADDRLAADIAANDAAYEAAVAARVAIDKTEAANAAAAITDVLPAFPPPSPSPSPLPSSAAAPTITSAPSTSFTVGVPGTFGITTHGVPPEAELSNSGALPTGVGFTNNGNGTATISGTPVLGSAGTYTLPITASNGAAPNATQNFILTVNP